MQLNEFNENLRTLFIRIKEEGFKTSDLTRLLFPSMSSQLSRFIRAETNFGIKPISNIASHVEYDIHMVAIKRGSAKADDVLDRVEELNSEFLDELQETAIDYLTEKSSNPKPRTRASVNKVTIDEILNDLTL